MAITVTNKNAAIALEIMFLRIFSPYPFIRFNSHLFSEVSLCETGPVGRPISFGFVAVEMIIKFSM